MKTYTLNDKHLMITQVIKWNEDRYGEGGYDPELTLALLTEELSELYNAKTQEDTLDAIGDVAFVLIGSLGKYYSKNCRVANILSNIEDDSNKLYVTFTMTCLKEYICKFITINNTSYLRINDIIFGCLEQVIISNNTKSIDKVSSNIKANINKGSDYKEPDFSELLKTITIWNTVADKLENTRQEIAFNYSERTKDA